MMVRADFMLTGLRLDCGSLIFGRGRRGLTLVMRIKFKAFSRPPRCPFPFSLRDIHR